MQTDDVNDHNTSDRLKNEREVFERAVRPRTDPLNRNEESDIAELQWHLFFSATYSCPAGNALRKQDPSCTLPSFPLIQAVTLG